MKSHTQQETKKKPLNNHSPKEKCACYICGNFSHYVQDYEQFKQKEASGRCGSGKETNTQSAAVVADILKEMP